MFWKDREEMESVGWPESKRSSRALDTEYMMNTRKYSSQGESEDKQ